MGFLSLSISKLGITVLQFNLNPRTREVGGLPQFKASLGDISSTTPTRSVCSETLSRENKLINMDIS